MAEVVEDHLEDGDEETEDWGWEEVDMLIPGRLRNATIGDREDYAEDEMCCSVEDEVYLKAGWMWEMLEMKRREKKVRRRPRIGTRIQGKLRQGL